MKKTLLAGLGAGALSLSLVGAGTFAAWSDFAVVDGNESGASVLTIDVSAKDGSPTFTVDNLVPGGSKESNIYLVNRDNGAVPLAALSMKFENVAEHENGCASNSEALADTTCADGGDPGEFGAEAKTQILKTAPGTVASAAACPNTGGYGSLSPSTHNRTFAQVLSNGPGGAPYQLGELAPGEGVCLRMNVSLPAGASNASQGDSVSYDLRFDLAQVLPMV